MKISRTLAGLTKSRSALAKVREDLEIEREEKD